MAGPFFPTRVRETSVSTGIGVFQLAGAVSAFRSFTVVGDGNTCHYAISDGIQYEEGLGLFTETPVGSLNTLTRVQVFSNSDGTTVPINFGVGTKEVFITPSNELLAPRTAKLLLGAPTSSIAASTPTDIVWNVDFEDPYDLHSPTVQEVFEADISGLYRVHAGGLWGIDATGVRILRILRDGDVNPIAQKANGAHAGQMAQDITTEVRLAAGNRVRLQVEHDVGAGLTFGNLSDGTRQDAAFFTIERIGA